MPGNKYCQIIFKKKQRKVFRIIIKKFAIKNQKKKTHKYSKSCKIEINFR